MRGHIRKRGNTWSVVVDLGTDETGRRRQKWHSGFRNKKEATQGLTEILGRLQAGTYIEPSRQTLAEYLRDWLPVVKSTVRPGTWSSYRLNMEAHVMPRIGHIPLNQLGALHLNGLYAELLASGRCRGDGGLSPRTVRYTHTILHRALRDAVRWGLLARNPADLADPPKHRTPEMQVWSIDELRAFLDHARPERLYALWLLLATTGLRRGEALGLRWEDLDLDAGRAAIRQTLGSVGGKLSFSTPKTAKSRRSVSLEPRDGGSPTFPPQGSARGALGVELRLRRPWIGVLSGGRQPRATGHAHPPVRRSRQARGSTADTGPRLAPHLRHHRPGRREASQGGG